jgi:hypothetical protein
MHRIGKAIAAAAISVMGAAFILATAGAAEAGDASIAEYCRDAGPLGFTGGTAAPPQLYGSFGPGAMQDWDVKSGEPTGEKTEMKLVTALPNGTTVILWGDGPNTPGNGIMTIECSTGWDCFDDANPAKGWESGIIFNAAFAGGADYVFCHIFELTKRTVGGQERDVLLMWETGWVLGEPHACPSTLSDAMAGAGSYSGKISYMDAPNTGQGAPLAGRDAWSCDGVRGGVVSLVNDQ